MTKVIGVGLGKTGTTTLAAALRILGYRHVERYDQRDLIEAYQIWDERRFHEILSQYDSVDDFPWPYLYDWVSRHYEDTKFVLTLRSGPDDWYRSLCKHAARGEGRDEDWHVWYGCSDPERHRSDLITLYEEHKRAVTEFFGEDSERLLVVSWDNGDGWHELCRFLNLNIPDMPFPHSNRAPSGVYRILKKADRWAKRRSRPWWLCQNFLKRRVLWPAIRIRYRIQRTFARTHHAADSDHRD